MSQWENSGWGLPVAPEVIEEENVPDDDLLDTEITGPDGPIPGVTPPRHAHQLPILNLPSRNNGVVWWVSTHGGSGASTLAALDGAPDAVHGWPTHPDGQDVVLVARRSALGLTAAMRAMTHYASGEIPGVNVLGVVIVPTHKGKTHPEITRLLTLTRGVAPRIWETDFHPDYLAHLDPHQAPASKQDRRLIKTIHTITKG